MPGKFSNSVLLAGALLAGSLTVEAQGLTRAQAGRVAVAQCYARCTELAYNQIQLEARLVLDGEDGEWSSTNYALVRCRLAQIDAIAADACRAGCVDIETAYGVRSSHVRTRYHWLLNRFLRDMRTSGLWSQWNRFPEENTPQFGRACARYVQVINARNARVAQGMEGVEPSSEAVLQLRRQEVIENEYVPDPPSLYGSELLDDEWP